MELLAPDPSSAREGGARSTSMRLAESVASSAGDRRIDAAGAGVPRRQPGDLDRVAAVVPDGIQDDQVTDLPVEAENCWGVSGCVHVGTTR
jgi:hypothetical protein